MDMAYSPSADAEAARLLQRKKNAYTPGVTNPAALTPAAPTALGTPGPLATLRTNEQGTPADPRIDQAVLRSRDQAAGGNISDIRYLQSHGNKAALATDVDQMVLDRVNARGEAAALDRSLQQPRKVLGVEDYAEKAQVGDRDMLRQVSGPASNDPGYAREAARLSAKLNGPTNAAPGLDPKALADDGYMQQGLASRGRAEAGRGQDMANATAAGQEYQRLRNARTSAEDYGTQGTAAVRGMNLANAGAAQSEAEQRKALADAMKNPAVAADMAKAQAVRAAGSAEKGQLDLDKTRADIEAQRRDIAGSKYLDEKAEQLYGDVIPTLNQISDQNVTRADLPRVMAVGAGLDSLMTRMRLLSPEAQDHYRQKILTELGNPSPEEFDYRAQAHNGLFQTIFNNTVGLPFNQGGREAVSRLEMSFKKLKPFLYQQQGQD